MSETIRLDHAQLVAIVASLLQEPAKERVNTVCEQERLANPHNDGYGKPRRRDTREIIASIRVLDAINIVDAALEQTRVKDVPTNIGSLRREV